MDPSADLRACACYPKTGTIRPRTPFSPQQQRCGPKLMLNTPTHTRLSHYIRQSKEIRHKPYDEVAIQLDWNIVHLILIVFLAQWRVNSYETPPAKYQRVVFARIQAFPPHVSNFPFKRLQDLEAALPAGVFDGLVHSCALGRITMVSPALQTPPNLSISLSYQAVHSHTILRVFLKPITSPHSEGPTGAFGPPQFSKSHYHRQFHNQHSRDHQHSHDHDRNQFQYHLKTRLFPTFPQIGNVEK